jgi:membrane associated rhomboid family serine protease
VAILPVRDDNPLVHTRFPFITVTIIGVCVALFAWQLFLSPAAGERFIYSFGAIPAVVTGARSLAQHLEQVPPWATLITSMFLHGGWLHLISNMVFLWVFGDNVEDACGHVRYALFYVACGVVAALVHVASEPTSVVPVIGASGAVSGVLGAYLVLHPRAKVMILVFFGLIAELPAVVVLSVWIAFQVFNALMQTGSEAVGVAWWAHIGGFVAGALLIVPFRRKGVPLFARSRATVRRHTLLPGRSHLPRTLRRR